MKRNALYFHLAVLPEMGPAAFRKLRRHFDTLEDLLSASQDELVNRVELDAGLAGAVLSSGERLDETMETLETFAATGIGTLYPENAEVPLRLKSGRDDWHFLTVFGNVSLLDSDRLIAIVGRRRATEEGLSFAHDLAAELARGGAVTISGMARGIDQAAHLGSLSEEGGTVGLVPMGILQFLRENHRFPKAAEGEERSRLLLVSGAPPNETWSTAEAMRRNRWIANWSDAVVVVEAGEKGGTWKTARNAKKVGKPLWVAEGFDSPDSGIGNAHLRSDLGGLPLKVNLTIEECAGSILASCSESAVASSS